MKTVYPISLTVFFPTYNEEKNIAQATAQTVHVLEQSPYVDDYEVLIIDDGSSDDTPSVASKLAKRFRKVKVITHEKNQGYGSALKTGLASASKDYVFFTDADLQFDILELQSLLVHIPKHDAVIGYRSPRRDPFMRLVNAKGWNALNRFLFGLRIRDIDCAFKLFKRDVVQRLNLHSGGAMINAEILIRLNKFKARIKEVPVSHLPRTQGSPTGAKPSVILRALGEMITLYRGDLGSVTHKQAVKFMMVGVVNTLLDIIAYIVLTRTTGAFADHLVLAKFLSFLVGTVSSLILNRYWTFEIRTRPRLVEIARFYATVSVSLFVNVMSMNILVSLGMYDLLALLASTLFTFAIGFTLSKWWVFKQTTAPSHRNEPPQRARA